MMAPWAMGHGLGHTHLWGWGWLGTLEGQGALRRATLGLRQACVTHDLRLRG